MAVPVLRHALDKVRYFRNVLLSEEERTKVRIIVGHGGTGKTQTLHMAIADLKHVPVNSVCVLNQGDTIPRLPVASSVRPTEPILIYIRWTHDALVDALLEEYDEEDRELVYFEADPGGLY